MRFALTFLAPLILASLSESHAADAELASLQPPKHIASPLPEQAVTNRAFTGIPSMAVAPKGRLWATWYAGVTPGEDENNYVVISTSGDNGATWKEVLVVDPDASGPVRSYDPELWVSPDGRLFAFWAQMDKKHQDVEHGVWCMETSEPDAEQPKWSKPRRITDGVMMCKPLVLSSGEWVLPVSTWREHDNSAQFVASTDQGKTWTVRGGCNVPVKERSFDEHMFIERKDHSLWLLVRTRYNIGESVSTDGGKTWPELVPSKIAHTSSRFFVRRLASGNLLLVKHGPIATATGRSHLTAYVSKDDGQTWLGGLLLDERTGVSYPDGQQTDDGLIRVIYDYSRTTDRNILMASFREDDVLAGKEVSGAVKLRQLVSKGSGGKEKPKPEPKSVKDNADGEPLRLQKPGKLSMKGAEVAALAKDAKLFTDRAYVVANVPAPLKNAQFIVVGLNGDKVITCDRAGTVWFLTPLAERNKDTQVQALIDQGFKKVALPEVPLFGPSNPGNYCSLFQKDCAAGETIHIGKWAVPVFMP